MNMTNDELLRKNGWVYRRQNWYRCVLCDIESESIYGWFSPGYRFYHPDCLLKSERYKRMLDSKRKRMPTEKEQRDKLSAWNRAAREFGQ